jgi:uncharacterized membrane protein SpoIIM required for sporulation
MKAARFLETRGPAWDRLEALLAKSAGKGLAGLGEEDLHELTRLYPAVAVDVARARMYGMDAATQQRVNRLAIAAHGLLYRRARAQVAPAVWAFFVRGYPRLFRRLWPHVALAAALFLVAGTGAYVCARMRPDAAYLFVPASMELPSTEEGLDAEDMSERFRMLPSPPLAAGVMANNVSVAFTVFALGITAGLGTCYVILANAVMLGGMAAHFTNHRLAYEFWSFILPHGVLEVMAILIAAAAGLRLGLSLALPGRVTRMASLRAGAREAVLLVLGTVPLFVVAGMIEGFVTPSGLPGLTKMAVGAGTGFAAAAYLLLAGHGRGSRQPGAAEQQQPGLATGGRWT